MSESGTEPEVPLSGAWSEIAPGIHLLTTDPAQVNLGLIVGPTGAVVVDTGSSPAQGRALRESIAGVTDVPLIGAIVTHHHYDHAFGLAAFDDLDTIGHESLRERLLSQEGSAAAREQGFDPATLTIPHREIAVAATLDLGDGRRVEAVHIGRGHTDGDVVVMVPDADVVFAGDLLESAAPPDFGPDSRPMEWAATLDGIIGLMGSESRAVPGHGDPVDREFVFRQRSEIAAVSGELQRLVEAGVAEADAAAQGSWPYPVERILGGIANGYAALSELGVKGTRPTLPLA